MPKQKQLYILSDANSVQSSQNITRALVADSINNLHVADVSVKENVGFYRSPGICPAFFGCQERKVQAYTS